jgi:hypothetical protein
LERRGNFKKGIKALSEAIRDYTKFTPEISNDEIRYKILELLHRTAYREVHTGRLILKLI